VYKYTPVHASVLATARTLFGSERAALGIIAAAVIVLLALVARELGARPGAAALTCVAFACSPVWLLQSLTFLPYCEALVWLLAFLWCFLRGFRLQSTWWLVGAGGFAGLAFFARPFEGAVFVLAVVVYKIWTERGHGVLRPLAWCALGAVPGALLLLAYNWYSTGDPFLLAFQITGRSDTLGFGVRHVLSSDPGVNYTIGKAFSALANNMLLVITWTFGSFLGLIIAAIGFSRRADLPRRAVLSSLLLLWPLAFFFFWGAYASVMLWDITKFVGPFYYLPMALIMAIALGVGVVRVTRGRGGLIVALMSVLATVTLITLIPAIETNHDRTAQRRVVDDLVHTRLDDASPSLLFMPTVYGAYLQNPFSFLRNPPDYDGRILYATHGSDNDFTIVEDHPDRTPYVLSLPSGYGPDIPAASLHAKITRLKRVTGPSFDFRVTASQSLANSHPLVRVILGTQLLYLPMPKSADGSAISHFTVTPKGRGATVTSVDDPSVQGSTRRLFNMLHVAVVKPDGAFSVHTIDNHIIPLRDKGPDLQLLWPGDHNTSTTSGPDRVRVQVSSGQSANE
jgi:hypothetical protein